MAKLYSKLARLLKVKSKNLLLTSGSDTGIKTVFECLVKPGDKVLRTEPTFAMYGVYCKMFSAKEIKINYKRYNNKFYIDLKKLKKEIKNKKPKLICLPVPDSPTGSVISDNEMDEILKISRNFRSIVLIDEAYFDFYKKNFLKKINKFNNLIIVRSFSKGWGLAGLRLGCLISNDKIINILHKVKPMYEINNIGAKILEKFIEKKYLKNIKVSVNKQIKGKKYFIEFLKKRHINFIDTKANFIHVELGKNEKKIEKKLNKIIYYRNMCSYKQLKNFHRFTLTDKNNFIKIKKIIDKYYD